MQCAAELSADAIKQIATASTLTDPHTAREALRCLQMDGAAQTLAATDGRRAALVSALRWPWSDARLVRTNKWFSATAVQRSAIKLRVEDLGSHVMFSAGRWSLRLPYEEHRYPAIDRVIPDHNQASAAVWLSNDCLRTIQRTLKALPKSNRAEHNAITLDFGARAVIRFNGQREGSTSEVWLPETVVNGSPVRVAVSRQVLRDISTLKLTNLRIASAQLPIWSRSGHQAYAAMPLHPDFVLQPNRQGSHAAMANA